MSDYVITIDSDSSHFTQRNLDPFDTDPLKNAIKSKMSKRKIYKLCLL